MWLLTVYEVLLSTVEEMERKFNKHLRRWLGISPSFTSLGFYIRSGQLQLPLSSVVEEFKVAKCRLALTYRDSRDQLTREAGVRTRSGCKWATSMAINQTKCSLRTKNFTGNPCTGRQGLGTAHFQQWSNSTTREKIAMIQDEVRNLEEEGRRAKSIELATQGAVEDEVEPPQENNHMEWTVTTVALPYILSTPSSVWHLTNPSQFAQVREEGGPTVQVLWRERNNVAYSVRV